MEKKTARCKSMNIAEKWNDVKKPHLNNLSPFPRTEMAFCACFV
jgi:hypothetical protein